MNTVLRPYVLIISVVVMLLLVVANGMLLMRTLRAEAARDELAAEVIELQTQIDVYRETLPALPKPAGTTDTEISHE